MKKMREVKDCLFGKYGMRCEVCGKEFQRNKLTGHHIIEKSHGGDVSEDNILIACKNCHFEIINNIEYDSKEYWELMDKCLEHRKEATSE